MFKPGPQKKTNVFNFLKDPNLSKPDASVHNLSEVDLNFFATPSLTNSEKFVVEQKFITIFGDLKHSTHADSEKPVSEKKVFEAEFLLDELWKRLDQKEIEPSKIETIDSAKDEPDLEMFNFLNNRSRINSEKPGTKYSGGRLLLSEVWKLLDKKRLGSIDSSEAREQAKRSLVEPRFTGCPLNPPTDDDNVYFLAHEIVIHNRPDDCWVIVCRKVFDITELIQSHLDEVRTVDALLAFAGKDISHWFDTKGDLKYCIDSETGVSVPYCPHGSIFIETILTPDFIPWWKSSK